jgi:hypothetical protein
MIFPMAPSVVEMLRETLKMLVIARRDQQLSKQQVDNVSAGERWGV